MVNFVRTQILNQDGIAVHVLNGSSTVGTFESQDIPIEKCYKDQRFLSMSKFVQSMAPVYSVSDQQRYFDINAKIALLHGSCISNKNNNPVSPLQFRQQHPDLEFWLQMPELDNVRKNIPLLSLHFDLDSLEIKHAMVVQKFVESAHSWIDNDTLFRFIREHYHAKCMLSGLQLKKGNHVILLDALLDELPLHWHKLVLDIVNKLSLEVMEDYGARNLALADEIKQWVDSSSYKRIAQRRAASHAELFCSTLKHKLFTELENHLNTVILKVIHAE